MNFENNEVWLKEALLRSKARYANIINIAHEAIISINEKRKIILFNQGAEKIFGYSAAEILGQDIEILLPERYRSSHPEHILEFSASHTTARLMGERSEIFGRRKNGEDFPAEASISKLDQDDQKTLVVILRDISENKKAELLLKENEDRLRRIIEVSPSGILIVDSDGIIQLVNPAILDMLNITNIEDVRGKELSLFIATEHVDYCSACFNDVLHNSSSVSRLETFFVRHKSKNFPAAVDAAYIDWNGSPAVQLNVSDITERKRAEERNVRIGRIFEASLNEIYTFEADTFKFTQANTAAQHNLGYTMEELQKLTPIDIKPEFTTESFEKLIAPLRLGKKEKIVFETIHKRKDQTIYNVEVHLQLLKYDQHSLFTAIVIDITERKKNENELYKLSRAVEQSAAHVIITDTEGLIEYVNPAFEKDTGFTKNETIGKKTNILKSGRHNKKFYEKLWLKIKAGEVFRGTVINKKKNGHLYFEDKTITPIYDDQKRITHFVSTGKDVTEQHLAVAELKKSEAKYRKLFEEDLTGNYISTPDCKILICNPAFASIFGFNSVKEALGSNILSLYSNPETRDKFVSLLRKEKVFESQEVEFRTKDGRQIHVIQNVIGSFDKEGELIEIKGYIYDITEHKKLKEQLRQSQKMESIGHLAGGVAHDFNNLLTVINGYSEILLDRFSKNDLESGEIKQIKDAGERAASLTSQLLAFSRKQIIQPKVLNMNTVVKNIEKMLRRLISEDIELIMALENSIGAFKADPGQIEQVIMNLVVNARDAMHLGGKLTVETSNVTLDSNYVKHHLSVQPGEYIMLAISDTGSGMDAETKSKIFEPFFTTKEIGKGTGLGLSTVFGIIKQNNAHISVYSEPDSGTTFKMYFPRTDELDSLKSEKKNITKTLNGTETILVAEDDIWVRELTISFLTHFGYNVLEAENGEQALSIFRQNINSIPLVISDVIMPKMGGRELWDNIVKLNPKIQILFTSGYTDSAIDHHGVLNSGVAFIQKPFTAEALGLKTRELLDL